MYFSIFSILFISIVKAEFIDQLRLLPLRKFSGGFSKTVHFSESATSIKPICFDYKRWKSLATDLIAHKLCERQGFPTFVKSELVNLRSFSVNGDAAIPWGDKTNISSEALIFPRNESDASSCTHFWQVDCGSCYFSITLSDANALATTIRSPLYPHLPDNIICQYEITSNSKMDLLIEKVDLQPSVTVYSMGRKSEVCLNSFLQIQPLLPPGSTGDQGVLTVNTLCGQLKNITIPVNGRQVRLMLVTGGNNGKLFTGFRIRVLFVETSFKSVEMVVIVIGISIPLFCFFLIFFSHKLSCKRWSKTRNRRYLNHMTQQQRRHYRHSMWMGDLPRNGETIHETRTRRLQRLLESEENNYIMDNRITRPSPPPSQRPLPEIPEENYPEQVYSITGGEVNNNLDVSLQQLSNSSRIYQSLQPIRAKETPVYLELLNSGDRRTTDGRKVSGSIDLSPISTVYPGVTGKKKEQEEYLAYRGNSTSSRKVSDAERAKLADETPIRFFSTGLAVFSRRFSVLSSRVASMASYSSFKRKETNNLEESLQLIKDQDNLSASSREEASLSVKPKSASKENNHEKEDLDDDVFDTSNLV